MSTNINRYKPDNDGRLWPASDGEYVLYADHEAALALIPGEAVAWQWRQTYAGRWGNWNDCGLFATDVQKWRDLAEKLPNEVQVRPLYASPAPLPVAVKAATHRHKKRGSEYTLIGVGKMQAENWEEREYTGTDEPVSGSSVDMREVAIYRSCDDGTLWVRPREEFEDGRFEVIRSALSSPVGGMEEKKIANGWATVRVEDTGDGLIINADDAREFSLDADKNYHGTFIEDGRFRIAISFEPFPTPASDIAALREENEAQRVEIETARTFESLWKNHRDELLQQNEELIDELAATYEELINHNGDDLNDTRARRVSELRSLQHVATGER